MDIYPPGMFSVTDMTNRLKNKTTFNDDIGNWDVSGVNNMSGMFNRALKFNQDISSWNVSSVTDINVQCLWKHQNLIKI